MIERTDGEIPDLVSLAGAAAILRMSKQGVHKRVLSGDLPGKKVDGMWVFQRSEVVKLAVKLGRAEEPGAERPEPPATS
jgi:hypothetical protein